MELHRSLPPISLSEQEKVLFSKQRSSSFSLSQALRQVQERQGLRLRRQESR